MTKYNIFHKSGSSSKADYAPLVQEWHVENSHSNAGKLTHFQKYLDKYFLFQKPVKILQIYQDSNDHFYEREIFGM